MSAFIVGHSAHPDWRGALALAGAQVDAQHHQQENSGAGPLTLGFVYFTDHYGPYAQALYAELRMRWPAVSWVGSVGVGVCAGGAEYIDEPALALMLAAVPRGRFEIFSGAHKLHRIRPHTALVHADPATPDLPELITEMSDRTDTGYLFGGLASSRTAPMQIADGVWRGGLSGVAFSREVALVSRVTQGCQPVGPTREVTACERNIVTHLDGEAALPCLLRDLGLQTLDDPRAALPRLRGTLVGLTDAPDGAAGAAAGSVGGSGAGTAAAQTRALSRHRAFGDDTRVRHLIGLDPARQAVAVAELLQPGMRLAFCQRDVAAARRDLVRICSEIRDELESHEEPVLANGAAQGTEPRAARAVRGALYVSCTGRGGPHFGSPSAELKLIQHALGDVPLVGFFAAGEIAHHHLYGYTGVLTVFTAS